MADRMERDEAIRALEAMGGLAPNLAERLYDKVIMPVVFSQCLSAQGITGRVAIASVGPNATDGFQVSCVGCGRTARLPFPIPEGKGALCPDCMRTRGRA